MNLDRMALNALSRLDAASRVGRDRPADTRSPQDRLPPGRHRVLFQAAPVAILLCDPRGRILDANDEAVRLSGWPKDALRRTTVHAIVAAPPRAERTGPSCGGCWDGRLEHAEGPPRPVRVLEGRPLGGEDGPRPMFLLDLGDERVAQDAAKEEAEVETIATMARGVSHELSGLLTTVLGYVDLLRPHLEAGGSGPMFLDDLSHALDSAVGLAQSLGALSVRDPVTPAPVAVADLFARLVEPVTQALGSAVRLALDIPSDVPDVSVDPDLVSAAFVAVARGTRAALVQGGRFEVRVAAVDATSVEVLLSDTGSAVDPRQAHAVFVPYAPYRADQRGAGPHLAEARGALRRTGVGIELDAIGVRGLSLRVRFPRS